MNGVMELPFHTMQPLPATNLSFSRPVLDEEWPHRGSLSAYYMDLHTPRPTRVTASWRLSVF